MLRAGRKFKGSDLVSSVTNSIESRFEKQSHCLLGIVGEFGLFVTYKPRQMPQGDWASGTGRDSRE